MMAGPAPHAGKNAAPRPANKRGAARLAAVQALYQMDVADVPLMEVVAEYENFRLGRELDGEQYVEADPGWFRSIVSGVVARQREIDPTIHAALPADWPLARLEILLRAILRAGTFELQGRSDVPARVIISEYVDVAKAFFDGDEPGMVNGVLDRVARGQRGAEFEGLPARPDGKAREGAEDDGNQEKAG